MKVKNPIIPGFYPDPTICRVGEDYYLACSSFELFPGIPVFHSRDLAHWEQIGNAMTAKNHFHVTKNSMVGGVMAPTLRYHDGTFYILNANFADKGNYIVTAKNPAGPWSDPVWLTDVPGIDASIFFDDDGAAYIMGTGDVWDNGAGVMERGIWLAPYDIENFCLTGEPVTIFNSAMRGAASPEAPHLYHVGDYYYLLIAEGGTEHYHSVVVARSRELFGFYENCPANPVMTHRHMGFSCPITNVGHADLVETPDGDWYAVMLASRLIEGECKNLGRETFLCPVVWERDWPLFSPATGKLEWEYEISDVGGNDADSGNGNGIHYFEEGITISKTELDSEDTGCVSPKESRANDVNPKETTFTSDRKLITDVSDVELYANDILVESKQTANAMEGKAYFDRIAEELAQLSCDNGLDWCFWGTPYEKFYRVENGKLYLRCISQSLTDDVTPMGFHDSEKYDAYVSFLAKRQCQPDARLTCRMHFLPENAECAGIAMVQAMNHQIHLERVLENGAPVLRAVMYTSDYDVPPYMPGFSIETHEQVLAAVPWEEPEIVLQMEAHDEAITLRYGASADALTELCVADGKAINPEKVGCMSGTIIGMFASGRGEDSEKEAIFDEIVYM